MAESSNKVFLSVVVPIKNERDNIKPLVEEIIQTLAPTGWKYEIIYVDDGSTDDSFAVLQQLQSTVPQLRCVQLDRNYGQSAAFTAGINTARGELVATLDGDLQNDPGDIPAMVQLLTQKNLDMVTGYRARRHDTGFRRLQSRIANFIRNKITRDDIKDSACSVRVFRRECFASIVKFNGMHRFMATLFKMAGYKVEQHPVNHRPRQFGRGKYGMLNRVFKATTDLFAVRWLQKHRLYYRVKREV
ncbi:MAG: glycosyltransferase family 2 protein [Candidatus Sumerlaeia bacterium]|nr:glycosyltransferase family 2 protein [Candidatus Sumerlaeia bacterium]